jgi:glycosyltransferase involved in cell wall biosynthesis
MRLAFVTTIGFPWGGCELLWTATAKEALRQGHEVLVSIFDWPEQHPKIAELKTAGASFHYRRRFIPALTQRVRKKALNRLLPEGKKTTYHDYLSRWKPDLIFFNLAGGDELVNSDDDWMVFIRQTDIPFVVAYHSLSERPQFTERTIRNYWFLTGKARANLFTSRLQQEWLEHQIAAHIPAASIIHHPLNVSGKDINVSGKDIPAFPPMETVQFAIVGSLVCRWKGQDIALRLLSGPQWQDRKWVLNIYGEGPDRFYLEQLVTRYGLAGRVTLHGHTDDITRIWATNHLLVAPSRQDSGPIVCYEAMYFSRPVVGSYMGAMPQYILDGATGVLATGTSELDFATALEKAWQHRQDWAAWGINGRKFLDEHYDYNAAGTLLNLLTK